MAGCAAGALARALPKHSAPPCSLALPCLQKCADSAFCTRLRGNTSAAFVVDAQSVAVAGPRVTASLRNTADANGTFALTLTAYSDRTLRLFVDEAPSKGRFQVPDVLLPGLEEREQVGRRRLRSVGLGARLAAVRLARAGARKGGMCACRSLLPSAHTPLCRPGRRRRCCCAAGSAASPPPQLPPPLHYLPLHPLCDLACTAPQPWKLVKKTATKLKLSLPSAGADVELRFSPAALDVSVGGKVVMAWNGGKQFIFEHTREKQVRELAVWGGSVKRQGAAAGRHTSSGAAVQGRRHGSHVLLLPTAGRPPLAGCPPHAAPWACSPALRWPQEGDPEGWWAENFKSHHDTKPRGPTAVSFDLSFPGSKHL